MLSIDSFRIRERRYPNSGFGFHPINTPKNELCTCNIENTCPPGRPGKRGLPGTDGVGGDFKLGVGPLSPRVEKLGGLVTIVWIRVEICIWVSICVSYKDRGDRDKRGRGPTIH